METLNYRVWYHVMATKYAWQLISRHDMAAANSFHEPDGEEVLGHRPLARPSELLHQKLHKLLLILHKLLLILHKLLLKLHKLLLMPHKLLLILHKSLLKLPKLLLMLHKLLLIPRTLYYCTAVSLATDQIVRTV